MLRPGKNRGAKNGIRLVVAVAMFMATPAFAQSYINPIADTWLKEASPNENHGSDEELSVKNKPGDNFRTIYKFDISSIPAGANVTRADLRLRITGEDDSGDQVNVYRVTDTWSENTANWNNTGNDYDSASVYASFVPDDDGWIWVDLTPLVQAWVCDEFSNEGFMLIATSDDTESKYTSKEWDSRGRRPRLYLDSSGTNPCPGASPPAIVADWQLDDCTLGFTGSTVVDSGPNGLDGTTVGGVSVQNNGQLCSAAGFDGNSSYVSVRDTAALDLDTAMSMAVWVRHDGAALKDWEAIAAKGDSAYRLHLNGGCSMSDTLPGSTRHGFTFGLNGGCSSADLNSNVVPVANTWYHVATTYDGSTMQIFVNGNLASSSNYSAAINTNNFDLFIGENSQQRNRYWSGDIDELTIWDGAITAQDVIDHRDRTRPCSNCGGIEFSINHDNFGISCLDETIRVDVVDSIAGTPRNDYNAEVTLDTQTGNGTWILVSGGGTLTDASTDDGIATYTWPMGESTAEFALSYSNGTASMDIDVYQTSDPSIRDDDAEGNLAFSPNGFTLTAAPLGNPPPGLITPFQATQAAGTDFAVYLAAFGQTPNDPVCGIIESYDGPKTLKFWSSYADPIAGTVSVGIDGNPIPANEATANNQPVTFTNGQAAVTTKYKDVGRIQIGVKDDSPTDPDLPNGIRGATAAFVVKPATFLLSNIEDASGNPNPAASNSSGLAFVAAGEVFSATVTALDAEGSITPNYGQELTAETVRLTPVLVDPAVGDNPPLGSPAGFGAFVSGVATGTSFSWPEVGIVSLVPSVGDGDYLGAGDVSGTPSGNVGRFTAHHFTTARNSPAFSTSCAAGGYSYIGQTFGYTTAPVITLTARALAGEVTENYTGGYFKVDSSSLTVPVYAAIPATLDTSGLPAAGSDPAIVDLGAGTGSLTFSSGSGLSFTRGSEEAPFDADIQLSVSVADTDGAAAASNPVVFGNPGGIVFDAGSSMRYGRARFVNAYGSEIVNLAMPLRTEYYLDATNGFVANTDDSCTSGVSLSFVAFTENLGPGETCVLDTGAPGASGAGCTAAAPGLLQFRAPPVAGDFNLNLQAPGAGNEGSATIIGDVPDWLEFDWDTALPGFEDPAGTAVFGIFKGQDRRIYTRELY